MTQDETPSPRRASYSAALARATPSTINRAIQQIFSSYRASEYGDAEGFMVQLALVLADFSDVTVHFVSNPRTGIQRRSQWAPTLAEIITACEEHERYLDRTAPQPRRIAAPAKQPRQHEVGDIGPNGGRIVGYREVLASGKRPIGFFEKWTDMRTPHASRQEAQGTGASISERQDPAGAGEASGAAASEGVGTDGAAGGDGTWSLLSDRIDL